jgi:hypothetical protein
MSSSSPARKELSAFDKFKLKSEERVRQAQAEGAEREPQILPIVDAREEVLGFMKWMQGHPFWTDPETVRYSQVIPHWDGEFEHRNPRISLLRSIQGERWSAVGVSPFHERAFERSLPMDGDITRKEAVLDQIQKRAACGYQPYYFVNPIRRFSKEEITQKGGCFATNDDVRRVLWRVDDFDFDFDLPCGIEELFSDYMFLQPAMILQSSVRKDVKRNIDVFRYQALTPIEWKIEWEEDPRLVEEKKTWIKDQMQRVQLLIGSDVSVSDAKRIMRLPGLPNWKEWEKVPFRQTQGQPPTSKRVFRCRDSISNYILDWEETIERAEMFSHTEIGRKILKLSQEAAAKKGLQIQGKGRKAVGRGVGKGKLKDEFVSWNVAVENAHHDIPSVGDGRRHDALLSWAGQMCACSYLEEEQVVEYLKLLAHKGCNPPQDDADVFGILRTARNNWLVKGSIEEVSDEDERIAEEFNTEREVLPPHTMNVEEMQALQQQHREGSYYKFCHEIARQMLDVEGQKIESDDDYAQWLGEVVVGVYRAQAEDGNYLFLNEVMRKRFEKFGVGVFGGYSFKDWEKTRWGEEFLRMHRMTGKDEIRAFIIRFMGEMSVACAEGENIIRNKSEKVSPEFRALKQFIDQEIERRDRLRKAKLPVSGPDPELPIRWAAKGQIINEIIPLFTGEMHSREMPWPESQVVFQNGVFDVATGKFVADTEARTRCRNAVLPRYLQEGSSERTEELMTLPEFSSMLARSFPDDAYRDEAILLLIGYMMMQGNPFLFIFFFQGVTSSGKSTLANILCELLGRHNFESQKFTMLNDETGLAPARDKLMLFIDEAESSDRKLYKEASAAYKSIASGGFVRTREKYEAQGTVKIRAKPLTISNAPIPLDDAGGAISSRMVTWLFEHSVHASDVPEEVKHGLVDRVLREANAIATRAVEVAAGRWALGKNMFSSIGSSSLEAGERKMGADMDPLKTFIGEIVRRYEVGSGDLKVPHTRARCQMILAVVDVARKKRSEGESYELGRRGDKAIKRSMEGLGFSARRRRISRAALEGLGLSQEKDLNLEGYEGAELDFVTLTDKYQVTVEAVRDQMRESGSLDEFNENLLSTYYQLQVEAAGMSVGISSIGRMVRSGATEIGDDELFT